MKLIKTFYELGEPFTRLVKVEDLNEEDFLLLSNLTTSLLAHHSDLFLKWIFWKMSK